MKLLTYLTLLTIVGCVNVLSPEEKRQYQERYTKAQAGVSDWINKHALYPDSYKSISFGQFSESVSKRHDEKISGTEKYVIKHTHKIFDKDSNSVTFSGYFILENDFDVNIIEVERSNSIGGAFPPQTQVWTDKFARPLNAQDSLELDKKQEKVMDKFIKEMKDGIESGDFHTEDPDGMGKLKNLIDTLEKKK
ncbi:MAG: hypothetical protein ACI8ZO_001656 [Flavobacteriales bacterium]|jgi:hypothetical protein